MTARRFTALVYTLSHALHASKPQAAHHHDAEATWRLTTERVADVLEVFDPFHLLPPEHRTLFDRAKFLGACEEGVIASSHAQ